MHSDGNLGITLATWVFALHREGLNTSVPAIEAACKAFEGNRAPDELGRELVAVIMASLRSPEPEYEDVLAAVCSWFGRDRILSDLGRSDSREDRFREIRRYRFQRKLPWLARIIDRFPDSRVGHHWVLIEELGDQVTIMDPYPWDNVDEEYQLPLIDFMVKWELGGLDGIWYR